MKRSISYSNISLIVFSTSSAVYIKTETASSLSKAKAQDLFVLLSCMWQLKPSKVRNSDADKSEDDSVILSSFIHVSYKQYA